MKTKHLKKGASIPLAASIDGRNGLPKITMPEAAILLDGELQERVTAYSISEGWLSSHPIDEYGQLIIDKDKECLVETTLQGKVEVVWI